MVVLIMDSILQFNTQIFEAVHVYITATKTPVLFENFVNISTPVIHCISFNIFSCFFPMKFVKILLSYKV